MVPENKTCSLQYGGNLYLQYLDCDGSWKEITQQSAKDSLEVTPGWSIRRLQIRVSILKRQKKKNERIEALPKMILFFDGIVEETCQIMQLNDPPPPPPSSQLFLVIAFACKSRGHVRCEIFFSPARRAFHSVLTTSNANSLQFA